MTFIDLEPASSRMADVASRVRDDDLGRPTPCTQYSVADLLDHIVGLTIAFTDAARKTNLEREGPPPPGDASRLDPEWRERLPGLLHDLVEAWRGPGALDGMTKAGGIDMPAEIAATVALEELVVHGWDLARAIGQPYRAEADSVEAVIGFVSQFSGPDQADLRGTAFGSPVPVPDDAPPLDRAIALTGRDPSWAA